MFDIGFSELALTGLIALLVLGPERLPPLIRTTGRWLGRAQRMAREFKSQLENDPSMREMRDFKQSLTSDETIDGNILLPKVPGSIAELAEQKAQPANAVETEHH